MEGINVVDDLQSVIQSAIKDTTNVVAPSSKNVDSQAIEEKTIRIKVVDQEGMQVYFQLKTSTSLDKLMDAYCLRIGQKRFRFLFDGQRILPTNTPKSLEIEDGDVIDAVLEQTGGC